MGLGLGCRGLAALYIPYGDALGELVLVVEHLARVGVGVGVRVRATVRVKVGVRVRVRVRGWVRVRVRVSPCS